MAYESLHTILLNALEKLFLFGDERNEDVDEWFEEITIGMNFARLNDNQKVRIVHTYFISDARKWIFNNMSVLDSWPNFVQAIRRAYVPPIQKQIQCANVMNESFDKIEN
ncbi:unnamed protein product [Rotaria sp. Silwood2]|nr:unnamed protein product [Rotaria sp. Silwood2]CAF2523785.1 unnamed protein product [Rotaria sp. Silwood2]CAF2945673.1 unnamed protein product [Rotaria sp. Silwood2]CAF3328296.1 unnamed protein product [Rotaria sp. Silwood2]CAF3917613.1 unnamed protein product [Rotaria sp. Silwood2]